MSKIKHIYALISTDNQIFYIGATVNIIDRLAVHRFRGLKFESYKVLESVEDSIWEEREQFWIKYGRNNNWPLVNKSNGGKGPKGVEYDEKNWKIMRNAQLGKRRTDETRQRISDGAKLDWIKRKKLANLPK